MAGRNSHGPRQSGIRNIASIGGRAAAVTMRPFASAVGAAAEAGFDLERRAVDRLLENGELDRVLASPRLLEIIRRVMASQAAEQLIDSFFDSGLFDHFVGRLLESDALWQLVDEIAQSPSVMAAISQQGLGFADQVGDAVRGRSRRADRWIEQTARRLVHRHADEATAGSDGTAS